MNGAKRLQVREWFADFDRHFTLKSEETGREEAAFIMRALGLRKGSAVLDVPCGAGRVAFHLTKLGCQVTGVDSTRAYIRRARQRFAEQGLPGTFLDCDMRALNFKASFDAAFNWQGSFGFFSDSANVDFLNRMARAVRQGGTVLVDQPNREYILRHFRGWGQSGTVCSHTVWHDRAQRVETRFTDTATGESWRMSIRLYTPGQFRRLFELAGLEVLAAYGDLKGSPYSRGSRRIHIVGKKT